MLKAAVILGALMLVIGLTYNATMYHVARECVTKHGWHYAYREYRCGAGY